MSIAPAKPFRVPDGYSYETMKAGFEATTKLRKPKALVDMANSPSRDNSMYEHLDPQYIKLVKRESRKRNFTLNDYLPNSLKRDASNSAITADVTSVGSGLLPPQTSRTVAHQKYASSASKGQTMNRLASLTSLDGTTQAGAD